MVLGRRGQALPGYPVTLMLKLTRSGAADTVVTAFPKIGGCLPSTKFPSSSKVGWGMLNLTESDDAKKTADDVVRDIVMETLDFEVAISTPDGSSSYLQVFAAEINFFSEVTRCHDTFEAALGNVIRIFPYAITRDTELFVQIDDIINEIHMILRVQQDQDHICVVVRRGQKEMAYQAE
ncbi:hypothetical protein N657DRAFT_685357 [Parathielavia appendiculata]|uniref:Uncharacterized protein n=1 Tax=Parathielavia appendiculata TaxID=2587402 RepID=A0AAN6TPI5_9PEZI|nr:hypothetical protein N657DRAFT_685357 [Parathielavia appendiculata]